MPKDNNLRQHIRKVMEFKNLRELQIYERGFDDGYKTAVRIYKPHSMNILNSNGELITKQK